MPCRARPTGFWPGAVFRVGHFVRVFGPALGKTGDDLGILIGRRGQTLSCLQYIVRLIVGHQKRSWLPVIIDVEGYKQRRYQALQVFARQMAEQVHAKKMSFTLEPMPAYERRIIHLALADHKDVTTESIGQGESRRVVILHPSQRVPYRLLPREESAD